MSTAVSLSPVSAAIYGALNVSAVTTLATGGIFDDLPEGTTYPCVLFMVGQEKNYAGMGISIGAAVAQRLRLRLYVFTQADGFKTAQAVMNAAIVALAPLQKATANGWSIVEILVPDTALPMTDTIIAGQKVQELVSDVYLDVEPA